MVSHYTATSAYRSPPNNGQFPPFPRWPASCENVIVVIRVVVLYSHHSVPVVVYLTTSTLFLKDKKEVLLLAIQCVYLRLKYCLYRTNQRNHWVPKFDPGDDPQTNANLANVSS